MDNFPKLERLGMLLLPNNHIVYIEAGLGAKLPNLKTIVLSNNKISDFSCIDALGGMYCMIRHMY